MPEASAAQSSRGTKQGSGQRSRVNPETRNARTSDPLQLIAEDYKSDRLSSLGRGYSQETFERHAAFLTDNMSGRPSNLRHRELVVRELQRTYGNQYVQRLVNHISAKEQGALQTKLEVSQPGDQYEQEADRVAKQVVKITDSSSEKTVRRTQEEADQAMMEAAIQRREAIAALPGGIGAQRELPHVWEAFLPDARGHRSFYGRSSGEASHVNPSVQRQPYDQGNAVGENVAGSIQKAQGRGQALPEGIRRSMEGAFGVNFSGVRVHTNAEADTLSRSLSARAFTTGHDIFLREGEYNPGSPGGRELLAHELTHVVQQGGAGLQREPVTSVATEVARPVSQTNLLSVGEIPGQISETTIHRCGDTPCNCSAEERAAHTAEGDVEVQRLATTQGAIIARVPAATPTAPEPATPSLIVEDSTAELAPGQMKRSEFLAQLRTQVTSTANGALAPTGQTANDCPYIDQAFSTYSDKDSQYIERAIHRYVPETAGAAAASEYIAKVSERVRRGIETWASTGEITGVPEGVPVDAAAAGPGEGGAEAPAAAGAIQRLGMEEGSGSGREPQAISEQLGPGTTLDGGLRSRMESAFGRSFANVRVHTDRSAARLAQETDSRAFTIGRDVAFGAGEYKPGTLVGDAIIAHELAHVLQQRGASPDMAPLARENAGHGSLEVDADRSAVGAIVSLWGQAKGLMRDIALEAMPRLRSGVRLQRCSDKCPRGHCWQVVSASAAAAHCNCVWKCRPVPNAGPPQAQIGPTNPSRPPSPPSGTRLGPGALFGNGMCGCIKIDEEDLGAVCDPPLSTQPIVGGNRGGGRMRSQGGGGARPPGGGGGRPPAGPPPTTIPPANTRRPSAGGSSSPPAGGGGSSPPGGGGTPGPAPTTPTPTRPGTTPVGGSGTPGPAPTTPAPTRPGTTPQGGSGTPGPAPTTPAPTRPGTTPPGGSGTPGPSPTSPGPTTPTRPGSTTPTRPGTTGPSPAPQPVGSRHPWAGRGPAPQWGNPSSDKAYSRHIRRHHGPLLAVESLRGRAERTGKPQGQWHAQQDWVRAEQMAPSQPGLYIVDFGRPVGRVVNPTRLGGNVIEDVTRAFIERRADGTINSAYPVDNNFQL